MNTIKEFMNIIDGRLKIMGISRWELLKRCGLSETLFSMALKRNMLPKAESICVISKEVGISVLTLLGIEEQSDSDDIKLIENTLVTIPKKNRKIFLTNIQNYCEEQFLPDDIKTMKEMLVKIPKKDRKMILMNIQNYYDVAMSKKK